MSVKQNLSGTLSNSFTIGKRGATIYNGSSDPSSMLGNPGDLYLKNGESSTIFFKKASDWVQLNDQSVNNYKRENISTQTATIENDTTYVKVTPYSGGTTLTLPAGDDGMQIIIKDSDYSSSINNIIIVGDSGELIDGESSAIIALDGGSLTLLFSDGEWNIV